MKPYTPAEFKRSAYNCPRCDAFAQQEWFISYFSVGMGYQENNDTWFSHCSHCDELSVWHNGEMIVPSSGISPLPNADMPNEVQEDYLEAREIVSRSPRGAAALLRLSIQKLCSSLGEKGRNINDDIASLVSKGLPIKIQKALDVVRVIGNDSVHPGKLDLKDDAEIAFQLFLLVNLIVESQISQHKAIDALYERLPEGARVAIEKRDAKK